MKRRRVLAAFGSGLSLSFAGCSGSGRTERENSGDVGTVPSASLEMSTVTDEAIARRTTYRIGSGDHQSERQLAATVIETGSETVTATNRPVPEGKPFVYDGSVYELSHEVLESTPAKSFRVAFEEVEEVDGTIAYDALSGADKRELRRYGWHEPASFALASAPVTYTEDEVRASRLVPEPETSVVAWADGTRGRFTVKSSNDADLKTYEYTAEQVQESAEQFGRTIREEHEFALTELSVDQGEIVSEAITVDHGYEVEESEPVPEAFDQLADQFSRQDTVKRVYEDLDEESSASGRYIVRYGDEVYWTEFFVREEKRSETPA